MFKLIHGGADQRRQRKAELCLTALDRTACALRDKPEDKLLQMRTVFYGVRYVASTVSTARDKSRWNIIETLTELIAQLTPRELLQIFPVEKTYDGDRWEAKDYFFTMDVLRQHGLDKPLGESVLDVLWDYANIHVRLFNVAALKVIDVLRHMSGRKSLVEEWASSNGEKLTICMLRRDRKGRRWMVNNETGERHRVKVKRPRWARV